MRGWAEVYLLESAVLPICWDTVSILISIQAFLLYGPLSQISWPKKLSESRTTYSSLREHFLKYIDHPDDLQSVIDPLADDDNVCHAQTYKLSTLTSNEKLKVPVVVPTAR